MAEQDGQAQEEQFTRPVFEVGGRTYEIAFSFKRVEMYESNLNHRPIMTSFALNGGSFSLGELRDIAAYGLRAEGGGYVSPVQGREMAEGLIVENGYTAVYRAVVDVLAHDCGFFFKVTD